MDESALHDKCPACGVGRQAFEPYQSKISTKREFVLSLDIHPVVVHFPQAFIYTIPVVMVFGHLVPAWRETLFSAARVLVLGLPLVVLFGILTGLIDGVIRFKKATTPVLSRKLILGSLFLASSCFLALIVLSAGFTKPLLVTGLLLIAMSCAAILGLIGSRLTSSRLPG
jgi:hypothetical protein